jgi:hypothetical protein
MQASFDRWRILFNLRLLSGVRLYARPLELLSFTNYSDLNLGTSYCEKVGTICHNILQIAKVSRWSQSVAPMPLEFLE